MFDGPYFMLLFFEGPIYIFRSKMQNIIHESFMEWIFFQTSFNIFEMVSTF